MRRMSCDGIEIADFKTTYCSVTILNINFAANGKSFGPLCGPSNAKMTKIWAQHEHHVSQPTLLYLCIVIFICIIGVSLQELFIN